ncbi:MAG: hypothetical protein ACO3UU_08160 [Minisyncoccia bacterium]
MNYNLNPDDINKVHKIIDTDRYNGRINIIEPPSPDVVFKMQEKIALKNKSTEYREALGNTWEDNVLAQVYFSAGNIQIIQNALRAGVYAASSNKFVIAPQNIDTLKIIMRSIYLQHAEHRQDDITGQVERLNKLVLDYAIPSVYNASVSYMKYCQDQSTLVVPLELPRNHDRDYKQLEQRKFM